MKIIALQAENIKKLVAIEIIPKGNVVEITGKNGQGKTSVLDSIWWALGGAKEIQKSPIRNGEETGFIRLDLGEMAEDAYCQVWIERVDGSGKVGFVMEEGHVRDS